MVGENQVTLILKLKKSKYNKTNNKKMRNLNFRKSILLVLIGLFYLSLFSSNINAQKKVGQIWHCNTADNLTPSTISNLSIESITSADTSLKIINVFIHIIRRSDGTGGLTDA